MELDGLFLPGFDGDAVLGESGIPVGHIVLVPELDNDGILGVPRVLNGYHEFDTVLR